MGKNDYFANANTKNEVYIMEKKNAVLGNLQEKKEYTKQIIITSILIGVGVNTLTSGIIGTLGLERYSLTLAIAGAVLSIGAAIYYLLSSIKKLNKEIKLDGFIVYDPENKSIVPIRRYEVVEDMNRYLSAAFSRQSHVLCKPSMWCRIEAPHRRFLI